MLHDPLANVLNTLKLYEKTGKNDCVVKPISKLIERTLSVMKHSGYLGEYQEIDKTRGGKMQIRLIGKINNCGAIKPRYPIKLMEIEEYERQYLPAKNFGILILSTPQGVMSHDDAKQKGIGGILLAYVY